MNEASALDPHRQTADQGAETLLAGENRLLEMIAKGRPLGETLDALCRLVEQVSPRCVASILLVDGNGDLVWYGAAPTLPESYRSAIDGRATASAYGPCTLAARGQQVLASDIAADSRWSAEYRELASQHGLRACWSTPIESSKGSVAGVFEIYLRQPGDPSAQQASLGPLINLASMAIERAQEMPPDVVGEMLDALRASDDRYARAMDAAEEGHWDWNILTGEMFISRRMKEMLGFAPDERFASGADFFARPPIHPDDRPEYERAVAEHFAGKTARLDMEMRIVPRGETRWVHLTGLCLRDASGTPLRWAGSVTDVTRRKESERSLQQSERRFRQLFENSADALFVHDERGRFVDCNAAACRALGYTREEMLKLTVADITVRLLSEEERGQMRGMTLWERAIAGEPGRIVGLEENHLRRKDGTTFPVEVSVGAIEYDGRHLICASVRETTERRIANEALRESEFRFRSLTELLSDWYWRQDENLRFTYLSSQANDLTGYSGDSSYGKTRWELVNMTPLSGSWDEHKAVLAARKPFRDLECCRIGTDGIPRYLSMSGAPIFDDEGQFKGYHGIGRNITERKRIEEELRARQQMLDLAQKAARAAAFEWHIGPGEGQNRWSPDLEAMYGLAPGSYDGTFETWKKLVHPDDWPAVRVAIKTAQQTGDVAAEYRVVHKDGAIRWLQVKGRMLVDAAANPTGMVGFMLDVTERHLAEEELRRMERELRQAQRLEAMGTLAGGIAHDFNNLLGAILGYGEMALRDAPSGSRLRRDVESIMIAGERGRALVDRILAFSRSGIGEHVAVHVQEVVRETLALFTAKLPDSIKIEQRLRAGRAAVLGDATQIHQVLMNLATNAVQAMSSGGRLRVSLDCVLIDAPRSATIGSIAAKEFVVLRVADTGSGIPPEVLERIFDPFFTTKEVGVGTGLGLSLVHGIVTGLGGAIDVTTNPGKGSTFEVYLPRSHDVAKEAPIRRREQPKPSRGHRERILVVDDEQSLVTLVSEALNDLGYAASGFTSSAAALQTFNADPQRFDAVITDESMPGLSGSELIRKVRSQRPKIPILLVSGYLSAVVVRRARQAGADDVLKKPLSAGDLGTSLARLLQDSKHPSRPSAEAPPVARRAPRRPAPRGSARRRRAARR